MQKQSEEIVERAAAPAKPPRSLKAKLRVPLMAGVPLVLAIGGAAEYLARAHEVMTDDAFVQAAKVSINARVPGQVVQIAVRDNQKVRAGQLLFQVDPEPYRIAVEQDEAKLNSARLQVEALKATYHSQLADVDAAKATADFDQREYARKKALLATDFTSRSAFEQSESDLTVAQQHIASAQQDVANTVAELDGNPDIPVDQHPMVREAKAQLDRARLDLSYTTVVAPDDGVVTRVDDLQVGDYVNSGATEFSMMSSRRIWVEANFRETGMTYMRPGQSAIIDVDTYPGHPFKAHVVSIAPGTGSEFAVLPPENATGNWVKVVQRLPVRLEFDQLDPQRPLYSGMSVTAHVDTRQHAYVASAGTGALQ
ncbi:HlyD family secretion protein [Dyella flava]|uniref:HlyD family secretion protein n=1 Tax=Dyella flava TaxID=1920170 RepID=A0ABS2JYG9_9GAMM|nr:HlyD family secretion protein [Dyella flava]MBM7124037.1 HlyD family secretion protein [Dyella flava]GLQ52360.1 hemolysin D [Dyella flava]